MNDNTTIGVHWSFWVIGAVGLIFNLMGCMNYIGQMNAEVVASMPDFYQTMIENRPAWGTAAFAIAVFGGALGCLLLLLRKRLAVYILVASLLGAVAAQIPYIGMADLPREAWFGWLSQVVIGSGLVWYSIRARGADAIGHFDKHL
ncbi:MAG: hypothetical protein OER91_10780 [Gammaproteobacteria bacterium]|nr:hypothetical protein [Gammaproteobacteria bacterium]